MVVLLLALLFLPMLTVAGVEIDMVSSNFRVIKGTEQIGTTYVKQQTAEEAAVNEAIRCLCEVKIIRPSIRVNATNKGQELIKKTVTWSVPTKRENGVLLTRDELSIFVLWYKEENQEEITIDIVPSLNEQIVYLTKGVWQFKIRVEDTSGISSLWSDIVEVVI